MRHTSGQPIVIGIDHTAMSQAALHWGVDVAARRALGVRVVMIYGPSVATPVRVDFGVMEVPAPQAKGILDGAVTYARDRLGSDRVSDVFVDGSPAEVLLSEAAEAELLVVGSRGRGTARSVVMGSVSCAVAAHAACPVAVIRNTDTTAGKAILVGVDGSTTSVRALEFAFEEAYLRGAQLDVVHCWRQLDVIDPAYWDADHIEDARTQVRQWLANAVAEVHEKYPQVVVREHLVEGSPAYELTERAKDAQMVVVGSRGRGGFAGLLLGSVSQNLLHHAPCSVVVVR